MATKASSSLTLSECFNVEKVLFRLVEACTLLASDPSSNKLASIPYKLSEKEMDMYRSIFGMVKRLFSPDVIEIYERYFQRYLNDPLKTKQRRLSFILEYVVIEMFKKAIRLLESSQQTDEKKMSMEKGATPFHAAVIDSLLHTSILLAGLHNNKFKFNEKEEEMEDISILTKNVVNALFNVFAVFHVPALLETDLFGKDGKLVVITETEELKVRIFKNERNEMKWDENDYCKLKD